MSVPASRPAASPAVTLGTLPGLGDRQSSPAEGLSVERRHGLLGLGVGRQLDEGEAPRPTRLAIGDDLDVLDLTTVLLEERAQLRFVALVRQVTHEQSLA